MRTRGKTHLEAADDLKQSVDKVIERIGDWILDKVFPMKRIAAGVVKRRGEDIHIDVLRGWLKKIDFSLANRGCDHYVIVNHKGKDTNFMIYGGEIGAYNGKKMFGGDASGTFFMKLKEVEIHLEPDSLSFSATKEAFISFYNFDRHDNPHKV